MLKPLPAPPLISRKEARAMLGVRRDLWDELVKSGVVSRLAYAGPRVGGMYLRSQIEALAARVRGRTYGKRRELLGIGRKYPWNTR